MLSKSRSAIGRQCFHESRRGGAGARRIRILRVQDHPEAECGDAGKGLSYCNLCIFSAESHAISDNGFDASGTHLCVIRIVNDLLQCSLRKLFEFILGARRICLQLKDETRTAYIPGHQLNIIHRAVPLLRLPYK